MPEDGLAPMLSVSVTSGWTVVSVEGECDVVSSPALRDALAAASGGLGVVVDLTRVTFIDSTGLGVLIIGQKRVERDGRAFRVVVSSPHIRQIFDVTGLDDVFTMSQSLAEAIR